MYTQTLTFCDIEVEEVTVESSLHTASHNGNPVVEILHVEPKNPIQDIQSSVEPQGKEVVRRD